MKVIIFLLGFSHIALSTFLILYTKESVSFLKGLFNTYQLKYLSALPAVFSLLFLISASATTHPWILRLLGLLAAVETVVAFFNPNKIYSQMLDWYFSSVSEKTNRLFGMIGIVLGTVILTWIQ